RRPRGGGPARSSFGVRRVDPRRKAHVRISIVIPTYRRAAMLAATLPSYLRAGAGEVIVVDDGSGSPDAERVAALAKDHGLRLVALPEHAGLPAARNEGAVRAAGEWVVFGEDDVWFPPEYATTLIEHAE